LAAAFSLAFLLLHPGARGWSNRQSLAGPPIQRLPITLDGTIAILLALWAIGSTSLFASTPDAVRNQPLSIWVNWRRIASEPAETLWYLAQFSVLAATLYAWYLICRYVLVRKVLRRDGIIPFAYWVVAFVALATPLAGGIGLLMPLNIPEWTVIPSENHNPFDWDNFRFAIWLTVIILPLVLTVERLLAEQAESSNRHERVRAELYMLQQQVNPHFLFNTLNTLYALCLKDRAESAAAVIKLSDLLRHAVYSGQAPLTSLENEIAYLRNYLDLQMLRFGHRCSLSADWPEAGTTGLALPPMLLIMLIENAFKHGVEPVEGACEVRIALSVQGRRMRFDCDNSVPGEGLPAHPGLGLANLRRRLELLFGQNFRLDIDDTGRLWRVRLELELAPC
jgi:Histidine kinase